jgi:hypothetical protein
MTNEIMPNPNNVISMKTRKPMLPFQVRAAIMTQYIDSKERGHSGEQFLLELENRLISTAVTELIDFIRSTFEGK